LCGYNYDSPLWPIRGASDSAIPRDPYRTLAVPLAVIGAPNQAHRKRVPIEEAVWVSLWAQGAGSREQWRSRHRTCSALLVNAPNVLFPRKMYLAVSAD